MGGVTAGVVGALAISQIASSFQARSSTDGCNLSEELVIGPPACQQLGSQIVCLPNGYSIPAGDTDEHVFATRTDDEGYIHWKCAGTPEKSRFRPSVFSHNFVNSDLVVAVKRRGDLLSMDTHHFDWQVSPMVPRMYRDDTATCDANNICICPKEYNDSSLGKTAVFKGASYGWPGETYEKVVSCVYEYRDPSDATYALVRARPPADTNFRACGFGPSGDAPGHEGVLGGWVDYSCKSDNPRDCMFTYIGNSQSCSSFYRDAQTHSGKLCDACISNGDCNTTLECFNGKCHDNDVTHYCTG